MRAGSEVSGQATGAETDRAVGIVCKRHHRLQPGVRQPQRRGKGKDRQSSAVRGRRAASLASLMPQARGRTVYNTVCTVLYVLCCMYCAVCTVCLLHSAVYMVHKQYHYMIQPYSVYMTHSSSSRYGVVRMYCKYLLRSSGRIHTIVYSIHNIRTILYMYCVRIDRFQTKSQHTPASVLQQGLRVSTQGLFVGARFVP